MSRSTATMRDFARRLVARDGAGKRPLDRRADFGGAVAKMRGPLAALVGVSGFRSLLSRALASAGDEVRWLRAVHVKADGSLERPPEMAQLDIEEVAKGEAAVIAQLLGLLVAFIGEALTARLLLDVWPGISINDFDFEKKGVGKERK